MQINNNRKHSLREIAIINSARTNSSDKNNDYLDNLNEIIEQLTFFETIYELILDRNIVLPIHLTRTFFISLSIIAFLSIIKLTQRDNFMLQYSVDLVFLFISLLSISIIIYFRKYIQIADFKEIEIKEYLLKLSEIKSKILRELNKEIPYRQEPMVFINKITNEINELSIKEYSEANYNYQQ